MMPDKIYIPQNISRSDVTSLSFPDDKGRGIEYIRKDALLEWAESKHNDTDNMDIRTSMRMLIDKLNEM